MFVLRIPEILRQHAVVTGAEDWLAELPVLVDRLEREWGIAAGRPFEDATAAYVAEATASSGRSVVLKLLLPTSGSTASDEITALRLAAGRGCVALLRDDIDAGALLLERLGPSLFSLGLPLGRRLEILCDAAAGVWRPAAGSGLPTGADRARQFADYIAVAWEELDRPCSARAVDDALACARRREAAHDDERAVLVHGDVHQANALRSERGFALIDPDGLLAEPESDLGTLMRGDPVELMRGDPRERARWLADRTGLDGAAIWEWGAVQRVASGLHCTEIGVQPLGRQTLAAADAIAGRD